MSRKEKHYSRKPSKESSPLKKSDPALLLGITGPEFEFSENFPGGTGLNTYACVLLGQIFNGYLDRADPIEILLVEKTLMPIIRHRICRNIMTRGVEKLFEMLVSLFGPMHSRRKAARSGVGRVQRRRCFADTKTETSRGGGNVPHTEQLFAPPQHPEGCSPTTPIPHARAAAARPAAADADAAAASRSFAFY